MPYPKISIPLLVILILGWFSVFTVDQREHALLRRLGSIQRAEFTPGIHFKIPLIERVFKFDRRLLDLEAEPARFLTSEKKDVIVDSFVKWRIADVADYYRATGGDERRARMLLLQWINDSLRGEFGKRTVREVVADARGDVIKIVTGAAKAQGRELGLTVIDVRIKRIELPQEVSTAVYDRMRAERSRVSHELRSRGAEAAERIRAAADRERTVVLAEAYGEAESVRGEGDAKAAEVYAQAYGKNSEFYAFYRSLNVYKSSFGTHNDILLLEPDSEFFHYFESPRIESPRASTSASDRSDR
jgi:modulator of FtsH protease HflC